MVKDVEGLGTKLKRHALGNSEVLEQSHIEVGPMSVVKAISSGVAECQPARQSVSIRIVNLGPELTNRKRRIRRAEWNLSNSCPRIANFVWSCSPRSYTVGDPC